MSDFAMSVSVNAIAHPRPAATVVVARPSAAAAEVELFLVQRHHKSGFMAGAHVFPGGRVEEQDLAFAQSLEAKRRDGIAALIDGEHDAVTAAAFAIAAIRETAEECGVLLARRDDGQSPKQAVVDTILAALRPPEPQNFAALLGAHALEIDLEGLAPLAWWLTPTAEPKRYDTRFFAAWAPAGQQAAADLIETTAGDWFTPSAALAAYRSGDIKLAPPTLVTLEDLVGVSDLESLKESVHRPLRCVCPRLTHAEGGGLVLALPGDPLHEPHDEADTAPIEGWERTRIVQNEDGRFESATATS